MTTSAPPPTKPPAADPEKPAAQKPDKFHAEMPRIPGLDRAAPSPRSSDQVRQLFALQLPIPPRLALAGGIVAATLLVSIAIFWWVKSIPPKPAESSPAEAAIPEPAVREDSVPGLGASASDSPVVAASVEEVSKPWAAKKFVFVNELTRENVNAMVIRLPNGGLWAFSLQVPYSECQLEFVTDVGRVAKQFGYRASHPMVVNPCDSTVYDPLKVGPLGGNVWVRGEIVQGGDLRPPISINVQVKGHSIIADRIE